MHAAASALLYPSEIPVKFLGNNVPILVGPNRVPCVVRGSVTHVPTSPKPDQQEAGFLANRFSSVRPTRPTHAVVR